MSEVSDESPAVQVAAWWWPQNLTYNGRPHDQWTRGLRDEAKDSGSREATDGR